jgi:acyl-homoserine lactone acylase PvdQ
MNNNHEAVSTMMRQRLQKMYNTPGIPAESQRELKKMYDECDMMDNCAAMPLVAGFVQTLEVVTGVGAIVTEDVVIATGHGDVYGYIITPSHATIVDLYEAKVTLKNNNNTFILEEPVLDFSTLYQNGTEQRARGFRMKAQSTLQMTIDNSGSATALKTSVMILFNERGQKSQGLFNVMGG